MISIKEVTLNGALFGSALFLIKGSNTANIEEASDGQRVPQLMIYTGAGAICGALVGLGYNAGQKICPKVMTIATIATQSIASAYCTVAKRTFHLCIKLSSGFVGGILSSYASYAALLIAEKAHIIEQDILRSGLNEELTCPSIFKEIKTKIYEQIDPKLPLDIRNAMANTGLFFNISVVPAVIEEVLFRKIIQDDLLQKIPSYILKKVKPGKETLLQSKVYTIARVVITSSLFSAYYLQNSGILPKSYLQLQLISTFAQGLFFGVIKETNLGLETAILSHAFQNRFAIRPCFALDEK
jgi:membrane protease YdiL (CAAX protease family)